MRVTVRIEPTLAHAAVAEVPGCPELALDIDALWRELDETIAETEGSV